MSNEHFDVFSMKARTMEIVETSFNIFHCKKYLIEVRSCDEISRLNLLLQKNLSIAELMDWQHFPCPSVPASDFEVNTVTLKHHLSYQALMLSYKCLKSIGPKYIADFFKLRDEYFNPRVRKVTWYSLILAQSGCINPFQSQLWNKLPLYMRNSDNLKVIKASFDLNLSLSYFFHYYFLYMNIYFYVRDIRSYVFIVFTKFFTLFLYTACFFERVFL